MPIMRRNAQRAAAAVPQDASVQEQPVEQALAAWLVAGAARWWAVLWVPALALRITVAGETADGKYTAAVKLNVVRDDTARPRTALPAKQQS